jgi:hypothetical protein
LPPTSGSTHPLTDRQNGHLSSGSLPPSSGSFIH